VSIDGFWLAKYSGVLPAGPSGEVPYSNPIIMRRFKVQLAAFLPHIVLHFPLAINSCWRVSLLLLVRFFIALYSSSPTYGPYMVG